MSWNKALATLTLLLALGMAGGGTALLAQPRPAPDPAGPRKASPPAAVTDLSLFREGARRFLAEDYRSADRSFNQLLETYPDSALAGQAVYLAHVAHENTDTAPGSPGAAGRVREARGIIDAVLAGAAAAESGPPSAARRRRTPGGDVRKQVGELMWQFNTSCKEGNYEDAERYAWAALELDPENPAADAAVKIAGLQRRAQPQSVKDAENKIERALRRPVRLGYADAPLSQVLEDIRAWRGLNLAIDRPALEEAGISLQRRVSVRLEDVSLRSALNVVLRDAGLAYEVRDGVLIVSTPAACAGKPIRKVYPVGKLLGRDAGADVLIRLITRTIKPASWDDRGGPGTIEYYPLGRALVVSQTPDVQEQIEDFLAALHRLTKGEPGR